MATRELRRAFQLLLMMKKILKWVAIILVAGFALLQFTNPPRTNPPVVRDLAATNPPPAEITALLHAACYDCHSYETKWPLYSRIAPASWLVVGDVNEGRENFNFSDWPQDPSWIAKRLQHIHNIIDSRDMPPPKYTMLHPEARFTEAQRKAILDWTDATSKKLLAASTNQ
jgi:hypothetical protein